MYGQTEDDRQKFPANSLLVWGFAPMKQYNTPLDPGGMGLPKVTETMLSGY